MFIAALITHALATAIRAAPIGEFEDFIYRVIAHAIDCHCTNLFG